MESGWEGGFNALSTLGSVGIYEDYETDPKVSSMLNPAVLDLASCDIIERTKVDCCCFLERKHTVFGVVLKKF